MPQLFKLNNTLGSVVYKVVHDTVYCRDWDRNNWHRSIFFDDVEEFMESIHSGGVVPLREEMDSAADILPP